MKEEEAGQRERQREEGLEELLVKEGSAWQWFLHPFSYCSKSFPAEQLSSSH